MFIKFAMQEFIITKINTHLVSLKYEPQVSVNFVNLQCFAK